MTKPRRELGKFYTPPVVAQALMAMVDTTPRSILDLGCGHGALSRAAVARWGRALSLTTIDLDENAGPQGNNWTTDHRHHHCDLLDAHPLTCVIGRKRFDLAILNPPYGRRCLDNAAEARSREIGERWISMRCRSTLFMLHALEAVRLGGLVAAILPETLAIGTSSRLNRRLITSFGALERIEALPAKTFDHTEARTVMVAFRRVDKRCGNCAPWLQRAMSAPQVGTRRMDSATIAELGVTVVRGKLNTIEARKAGAFHLDTFKSARDGVITLSNRVSCQDDRAAQEGDILVARIGRNIADKVALVVGGSNAISDCVYRLRCPATVTNRVWNGLRSPQGKRQIEALLSGVTTRLLPMSNLLALEV